MSSKFIYISNDHDLSYEGARDRDGNFLNNGTCLWELVSASDPETIIADGVLDYETGSDGDYFAVIDRVVTELLVESNLYFIDINFACDGFEDYRRLRRNAIYRN